MDCTRTETWQAARIDCTECKNYVTNSYGPRRQYVRRDEEKGE